MTVLIVDPDTSSRKALQQSLNSLDRRLRVHAAEEGGTAWKVALKRRPHLVICAPELPDIGGAQFCRTLRPCLQHASFLSYANDQRMLRECPGLFQGRLSRPPTRLEVLVQLRAPKLSMARAARPVREARGGCRAAPEPSSALVLVEITAAVMNEPDLKFSLTVAENAPLVSVLKQLGKDNVRRFELLREGAELHATLNTRIRKGDLLLIKTSTRC